VGLTAVAPAQAGDVGSLTQIGTLGKDWSEVLDVTDDGTAVGEAFDGSFVVRQALSYAGGTTLALPGLGGGQSIANAISDDGRVIVGVDGSQAVRWVGGSVFSLGSLGGTFSEAQAVSADGSVIVGTANDRSSRDFGFIWQSGTMTALPNLSVDSSGDAVGISADGSVVVGNVNDATGNTRAVEWQGGAISQLNIPAAYSRAYGVSGDGRVIVGEAGADNPTSQAFRYVGGSLFMLGGMNSLTSEADAANRDGSIIVGSATVGAGAFRAFRWTAATGMKDLNVLLGGAGVDMTGISLEAANGISPNGQFIVGSGKFGACDGCAYVARYVSATDPVTPTDPGPPTTPPTDPTPPVAGVTTRHSVQQSIDDLAAARFDLMAGQHGLAAPLLGAFQPIGAGTELGTLAMVGSAEAGGNGRIAFGNGLSFLGGIAYQEADYGDAAMDGSVLGAGALRYVLPRTGLRPFAELGGWVAPDASFSFTRTYANAAGSAVVDASTGGWLGYAYGRGGVVLDLANRSELALSGEVGLERLHTDAYDEMMSPSNPFEAYVSAGHQDMILTKLRAQWTTAVSDKLDTTLWLGAAVVAGQSDELSAVVPGFGRLDSQGSAVGGWAEYGARVGYRLTDQLTVDLFADGISGGGDLGTSIHSGGGLRARF
jgi:probable HAF family extracellular repeat protein